MLRKSIFVLFIFWRNFYEMCYYLDSCGEKESINFYQYSYYKSLH